MGGKTTSTSAAKLNQISVQSSSLGLPLTLGWGRGRAKCNLGWYGAFTAIPHTTTQKAGKGLGGGSKNTTYTYTASIQLMIGEGPIAGIRTVYRDQSVFTDGATTALAQTGLSLAPGTIDQAPWGYLTTMFPDQALAYSGIAYVYAADYALSDSATLPNHSFEIDFALQLGGGVPDADASAIAADLLTNASHGLPGWPAGLIADWSSWSAYSRATGLLLSPVLESQVTAAAFLQEITDATNTSIFWSEGMLKTCPLGDDVATGNGVTWTPDLTPIYDLTEDDFCPAEGSPAVTLSIVDQSDAYNIVQVEFLDRASQYNTAIASAQDLDNIVTYGRRKQDPTSWHSICDAGVAALSAQLLLQRTLYIREQYAFRLPWDFALLEPCDLVTLTTVSDGLMLDRLLVRIDQIDEDEDGLLSVTAKPVLIGTASAARYAAHSGAGYAPNTDVAPGSVSTPALFNPPTSLTGGDQQVWCAAASLSPTWGGCEVWISADGTSYTQAGRIEAPARYGVLSAALPSHVDPDDDDVLEVDLSVSAGILAGATQAEMDAGATLALVGAELVAYRDADLTGSHAYSLSPLRRGLYGTAPAAHATGAPFVRLDDAIFKLSYAGLNVGSTVHVKLPSFNVYGRATEDLASVPSYTVSLAPATALPNEAENLRLSQAWTGTTLSVVCDAPARADAYAFRFYASDETTLLREITSSSPSATYTASLAAQDGIRRTYAIEVLATNAAGSAAPSTWLTVTNSAPAAVTSPAIAGGATTATATCDASTDADVAGYILFYANTGGFDPATTGGVVMSGVPTINVFGLAAGTYYGRLAAYDGWTADPSQLNLSAEISFSITSGGGSTPSGGGTEGGGFAGSVGCPADDELVLLANADRDGPGGLLCAGSLRPGEDWVWTAHETTGVWSAHLVTGARHFEAQLWSADGFGRATETHPLRIKDRWVRMGAIGTPTTRGIAVELAVDEARTFVTVQPGGEWVLNHNKTINAE